MEETPFRVQKKLYINISFALFVFGQAQSVKRRNRPLWIAKDRLCVHSGRRNRLESTLATLSQAKTQGLSLGGRLLMAE